MTVTAHPAGRGGELCQVGCLAYPVICYLLAQTKGVQKFSEAAKLMRQPRGFRERSNGVKLSSGESPFLNTCKRFRRRLSVLPVAGQLHRVLQRIC